MTRAETVLSQFQKPTGWVGRLNLWDMNRRHSKLTDWGLEQVTVGSRDTILDGGGRTVYKLAGIAREGRVYGVDHSEESVTASRRTNRQWVKMGRVEIQHASVSRLPFADRMFDLATAVETHYYWPDLTADLREVLRVLKAGGRVILIAEAYKGGKFDKRLQRFADAMKATNYAHLTVNEHRELLSRAGFCDVQVLEEYDKGWICALGRRPS